MNIRFWGAAGEVTGSAYEVTVESGRFMVDMGMFQGEKSEEKNRRIPETDFSIIKGCVLTHAHLDHCGRIPMMFAGGFMGKIWATKPTIDLVEIVWKDALKIAQLENGLSRTLYSEIDVNSALSMLTPVEYMQWLEVIPGVKARYFDAGHILGSASVELLITEGKKTKRVVFSGDLGNSPSPLVKMTEGPKAADIVVMESTYGNRFHKPRGEEEAIISQICNRAFDDGATVLMPAFSLERTQEFLHMFDHMKREGMINARMPIYLDSPMGLRATAVFEKYPEYFNEHMREHFIKDDPFDFPELVISVNSNQSHRIDQSEEAKVIIAGSGMMTGGRIVAHAKKYLPLEKSVIIFSGFQSPGTLGREILDGAREVVVDGLKIPVNAQIEEITTMSGHADQGQLLGWLSGIEGVSTVFLSHGEEEARAVLKDEIIAGMKVEVVCPLYGESFSV
jgi:metallo-beta-lactamase family protein